MQMEYLLGLSTEWKRNSRVVKYERVFRECIMNTNDRMRGMGPLVMGVEYKCDAG